jgi:hypothetical protein
MTGAGRGSRGLIVCAVLCVVHLTVPGAVGAKPHSFPIGDSGACPITHIRLNVSYSCSAEFTLRSSNGYRITVSAGLEGGDNSVSLSAKGPEGTAEYQARGQITANTVRARFGRLGRVAVRFHPSGRKRQVRISKRCMRGRPPVVSSRLGHFVGMVRFRGERGYTRISAHRATGGIGDPLANTHQKVACDFRQSDADRKRELRSVSLDASPPGSGVAFTAGRVFGNWMPPPSTSPRKTPPGQRILFLAFAFEKTEGMSVFRYSAAVGRPEDFVYDSALTSATVSPPAPFTGTGTFRRSSDGSTSWTGNLAAALPGLGAVRLTGGDATLATVADQIKQLEETAKK